MKSITCRHNTAHVDCLGFDVTVDEQGGVVNQSAVRDAHFEISLYSGQHMQRCTDAGDCRQ